MQRRTITLALAIVSCLSLSIDNAGARTRPRRGAAAKPAAFQVQPPFPCGTEFKVNCSYGPGCSRAHKRIKAQHSTNDYYAIDLIRSERGNGQGKSVVAVAAGVVRFAGWTRRGWAPYGRAVYIEHDFVDDEGKRYQTLYAHLDRVSVREGQRVASGTPVGTLGGSSRGRRNRFGAHLHFAMYRDAGPQLGGGQAVVPEPIGGAEDLEPGMRLVSCVAPTGPVALAPTQLDAVGGLIR